MKSGEGELSCLFPEDLLPNWPDAFRLLRKKTQETLIEKPKFGAMCEFDTVVESAADQIHIVFYLRENDTGAYASIDILTEFIKKPPEELVESNYYLRYEIIPNGKTKKLRHAGCVYVVKQQQGVVLPDGREVWNTPEKHQDNLRLAGGEISCVGKKSIECPQFYFKNLRSEEATPKPVKKDSIFD